MSPTIDELIRSFVAIGATATGVWFVIRLALHYQTDFTEKYAARLIELETRITASELEVAICEKRTEKLIQAMRSEGINIPLDIWDE